MASLADLSLAEAADLLRKGEVNSTELVEVCIEQADRWEPHVQALVARMHDRAVEEAKRADRDLKGGRLRGPLHGIPVVVKDVIDVGGVPTTAGSRILANKVADADATVVHRLRDAGAIITAKTNTHEFAFGALSPPTRNPWDLERMPGGSSAGSGAAVAARMTFGALGTDTAGSIREPACLCGIVGLKPTFGRVSCRGVIPLAWSMDTVGPMCRTVEDCRVLFEAIEGPDPRDPSSIPPELYAARRQAPEPGSLRVAVASELMSPLHPDVEAGMRDLLTGLGDAGVRIEEVSIGDPDEYNALAFVIIGAEAAAYHRRWLAETPELYQPDVLLHLRRGMHHLAIDYVDAQRLRRLRRDRMAGILKEADVILTPAEITVAPLVADQTVSFPDGSVFERDLTMIRQLSPFSLTGFPGISVPLVLGAATGLPVGAQIVAGPFQEEMLLDVAALVEALVGWDRPTPELPDVEAGSR